MSTYATMSRKDGLSLYLIRLKRKKKNKISLLLASSQIKTWYFFSIDSISRRSKSHSSFYVIALLFPVIAIWIALKWATSKYTMQCTIPFFVLIFQAQTKGSQFKVHEHRLICTVHLNESETKEHFQRKWASYEFCLDFLSDSEAIFAPVVLRNKARRKFKRKESFIKIDHKIMKIRWWQRPRAGNTELTLTSWI